ncbi:unnamed protein product, partial [Staurois parvus]
MTAGTGSHQASGHLARQRAPLYLARQWAPSQSTGMTRGTGSDIGSADWTAGIGSPGIRSIWLDSGHRTSSGARQWLRVNRHDSGHGSSGTGWPLARQRASGHQASGHLARQRAPRHLARQWAPSHQV